MAEPERKCSTCKFYEPAPIWRKGWCRNPLLYAPQQSHLVAEDDLDCSRGLSDYWEAADGTGPNAGVNLAISGTREPFARGGDRADRGGTEPPANPWESGQQSYGSSYGASYGSPYSSGPITSPPDDDGYAPHEAAPPASAGGPRYAGSAGEEEIHNPWEPGQSGYGAPPAQHEEEHGYDYGYGAPAPGQEQNPWQSAPPDAHGQGGNEQGGYPPGGYGQEQQAYPPAGYNEGGYSQGGYEQGGYPPGGYPPGGYGGYNQGGYDPQGGYAPPQPPNAPPTNAGVTGSGARRVVPQPAAAGRERSLAYYTEERYWTDYAKLIIPVVVVIVLLLFSWFIVTGKLRGGNSDATATAGASTNAASSAGAGTKAAGTPSGTAKASSAPAGVITASGTVPISGTLGGSSAPKTPQAGGTTQNPLPTVASKRFVVANTDGLGANLRDKPDTKTGKIVANVPEGTEVQATGAAVDGEGGTWYPVQVGNNSGFIRSDFLKAVS